MKTKHRRLDRIKDHKKLMDGENGLASTSDVTEAEAVLLPHYVAFKFF